MADISVPAVEAKNNPPQRSGLDGLDSKYCRKISCRQNITTVRITIMVILLIYSDNEGYQSHGLTKGRQMQRIPPPIDPRSKPIHNPNIIPTEPIGHAKIYGTKKIPVEWLKKNKAPEKEVIPRLDARDFHMKIQHHLDEVDGRDTLNNEREIIRKVSVLDFNYGESGGGERGTKAKASRDGGVKGKGERKYLDGGNRVPVKKPIQKELKGKYKTKERNDPSIKEAKKKDPKADNVADKKGMGKKKVKRQSDI